MSGNCFAIAGRMVASNHSLTLCHGIAIGRGPIEGKQFAHAWVEITDDDGVTHCIDQSNGLDVDLPQPMYYALGKIQHVVSYSASDALHLMFDKHLTFGPWDLPTTLNGKPVS